MWSGAFEKSDSLRVNCDPLGCLRRLARMHRLAVSRASEIALWWRLEEEGRGIGGGSIYLLWETTRAIYRVTSPGA